MVKCCAFQALSSVLREEGERGEMEGNNQMCGYVVLRWTLSQVVNRLLSESIFVGLCSVVSVILYQRTPGIKEAKMVSTDKPKSHHNAMIAAMLPDPSCDILEGRSSESRVAPLFASLLSYGIRASTTSWDIIQRQSKHSPICAFWSFTVRLSRLCVCWQSSAICMTFTNVTFYICALLDLSRFHLS